MSQRSIFAATAWTVFLCCGCSLIKNTDRLSNVPAKPGRQQSVNPLVGKWVNVDSSTRDITKLAISIVDKMLVVEMWGKCHPRDCFWGSMPCEVPPKTANEVNVVWVSSFKNEFQTIRVADEKLTLQGWTVRTDGSGRETQEYRCHFVRGDF
jgi:hypothetical protein